MKSKRTSPEFARQTVDGYLKRHGFHTIALTQTPQIRMLPKDHRVYVRSDQRLTVKCYGKYGLVQLYVRGGVRLPIASEIIDVFRSVLEPMESADLEYSEEQGDSLWLPEEVQNAVVAIEKILSSLLDSIGTSDEMIRRLLNAPNEYSIKATFKGVRVHALRFVCADCYLLGAERMAVMAEAYKEVLSAKIPPNTPYHRVARLIEVRWGEVSDA